MLSGEGNAGEWWKTAIGLISEKKQLWTCSTLFLYTSLLLFCTTIRETSRNLLVTRFMEEMSYVFFSFTFFSLPLIFPLHWWPLAFPILSLPLQNFHVVLPTKKMSPLFFIARSRPLSPFFLLSFAGLPPTFSFSLSFSCSIFQICGHDN